VTLVAAARVPPRLLVQQNLPLAMPLLLLLLPLPWLMPVVLLLMLLLSLPAAVLDHS